MAERLTTRFHGILVKEADVSKTQVITKLGQLEDILDKYRIESMEELDKRLQNLFELTCGRKNGKTIARKIILFDKIKQDRDTWKKACELACEEIDSCDNYGCKTYTIPLKEMPQYFYQQAKKELTNNYKVLGVDTNECKENE